MAIDDTRAAYRTSRSYRWVVVTVTTLTLVPLLIGVTGDAVFVVVSVTASCIVVGVVLWGIAALWYRPPTP